jgi:flagellar export protein FliJ
MKRFQFPLERVRDYRKVQMEAEQARLEECRARLLAVEEMLTELARQRIESDNEVRSQEARAAVVPVSEVAAYPDYRRHLDQMARMLERRRAEALARLEQQRQRLVEARRRFEILDRARGYARAEWQYEFDREQEALAGELFLANWSRKRGAPARRCRQAR